MNTINKYNEIIEWFKQYTPLHTWIYFNAFPVEPDTVSVSNVPNERELDSFIDGSRRIELPFTLSLAKEFDIGTSDINLEAMEEFENINEWVENQNAIRNFPDFGNNVLMEKVEVLETSPAVSVDNQNQIAKYQGQFKITYLERRN